MYRQAQAYSQQPADTKKPLVSHLCPQFALFSDKVLAPDKSVETVAYAQFNYNLQTASHLDFMLAK